MEGIARTCHPLCVFLTPPPPLNPAPNTPRRFSPGPWAGADVALKQLSELCEREPERCGGYHMNLVQALFHHNEVVLAADVSSNRSCTLRSLR